MTQALRIERVTDLDAALAIRMAVFVEEQNVPPEEEVDGRDSACLHWLASDGAGPVATLRVSRLGETAKIQRVAVLARGRGAGVGAALMRAVMEDLRHMGFVHATLGSQVSAIGFYERLGFAVHGPIFDDAGIPHRDMDRDL